MLGPSSVGRISCWLGVTDSWVVYSNYDHLDICQRLREWETYNVRHGTFSIYILLHNAILENTNGGKNIESVLVARVDPVENHTNYNLLPSRATFVPELRFLQIDNVPNVLHDTMECSSCEHFVFVVVRDRNEELGVSIVHCWS